MSEWQDIASAPWPTDYRHKAEWIVCTNRGRVFAAYPHMNGWVYGSRQASGVGAMPSTRNPTEPMDGWRAHDSERATHWMPLPDPPSARPEAR